VLPEGENAVCAEDVPTVRAGRLGDIFQANWTGNVAIVHILVLKDDIKVKR